MWSLHAWSSHELSTSVLSPKLHSRRVKDLGKGPPGGGGGWRKRHANQHTGRSKQFLFEILVCLIEPHWDESHAKTVKWSKTERFGRKEYRNRCFAYVSNVICFNGVSRAPWKEVLQCLEVALYASKQTRGSPLWSKTDSLGDVILSA